MHTIIKKLFFTMLMAGSVYGSWAQQQESVVVHLKDGRQAEYLMQDVDYIEVITPRTNPEQGLEAVGGTVANAVDLGLSVLWADHNLGGECPSDFGVSLSWDDSALSAWGNGWRMPTEEEWLELYENCQWQWVTFNGVGCRQVSTPSGYILLPAAGVQFGETRLVKGCLGLYMSATEEISNGTAGANIIGAYFDSANIYRMEFPKRNLFSVRLVKDK